MSVVHTVLLEFSPDAKAEDIQAAIERLRALKDNCIHPTTNEPYISSLRVGRDNSPEGLQDGLTHGFVVDFRSAEDRDYYVKTDPAHQAFVASLGGLVNKLVVLDFIDGVY